MTADQKDKKAARKALAMKTPRGTRRRTLRALWAKVKGEWSETKQGWELSFQDWKLIQSKLH